ncbi:DUF3265 domain-containing protein [Vibrio parahaemolyticus]|nr:DUF3265 domain-containing protein [Vibrio parahaemolyticus]
MKDFNCSVLTNSFKRDSARVAFLVCVGFGAEVLCGNIGIACFTP